mmetsp:Transcript_37719/g.118267  ORF Transcript_37719/g.118267 Transcript_37719/m.118267 type:complete len:205 (-) Transcript_37719:154-768(-)
MQRRAVERRRRGDGVVARREAGQQLEQASERRGEGGHLLQQLRRAPARRDDVRGVLLLTRPRGEVPQPRRLGRVGCVRRQEAKQRLGRGRAQVCDPAQRLPDRARGRQWRRRRVRPGGGVGEAEAEGGERVEAEPRGGGGGEGGAVVAEDSEVVGALVPQPSDSAPVARGERDVADRPAGCVLAELAVLADLRDVSLTCHAIDM